jgi:hypothetical protein
MTTLPATGTRHHPQATTALRMTPGRRVLLAVGVPLILIAIGWTAFGLIASFGTARFSVGGTIPLVNGQVVASFGGGDVTVNQGRANGPAEMLARIQYSLVRPRFSRQTGADGTHVKLDCGIPTGNCELGAHVSVPAGTGVNLSSQGGDMRVSGVSGNAILSSSGGDVTVSGGGSRTTVNTSGGDLTAGNLGGTVTFTTRGGDVTGTSLTAPATTVSSGGGDVSVTFTTVPDHVNISSAGGDVTVLLPRGSSRYDVSDSTDGGDSRVSVPSGPSSHVITVDSGGGDLTIAQAS